MLSFLQYVYVKNHVAIYVAPLFYSVDLHVCFCAGFTIVALCYDFESGVMVPPLLCLCYLWYLHCPRLLCLLRFFYVSIWILRVLFCLFFFFTEEWSWNVDGDCIEAVDYFWQDDHLLRVYSWTWESFYLLKVYSSISFFCVLKFSF